jgi:hypothetical protein
LRALAARGHDIHLLAERKDSVGGTKTIDNLLRAQPDRITFSYAPSRKDDFWQPLAVQVRLCLDYWRYLDSRYDDSPSLRARAARQAPGFASRVPRIPVIGSRPAMWIWNSLFRVIERAMPHGDTAARVLTDHRPDVLLMTPLLYFGSQQVEYVRAAKAAGIPCVLGVGSWDHLTTKGRIHERPDRVVVWNEFQRARPRNSMASVRTRSPSPVRRPTTTGSNSVRPRRARISASGSECRRIGRSCSISARRRSSRRTKWDSSGAGSRPCARRRIRGCGGRRFSSVPILRTPRSGSDFDPSASKPSASGRARGPTRWTATHVRITTTRCSTAWPWWAINTSALIESGIVGRPVFTVLASEFAGQQEGTLHFKHLKNANGGLLHVAATLEEHLAQLAKAVRGEHDPAKSRASSRPSSVRTGSTRRPRGNSSRSSRRPRRRQGRRRFAHPSFYE